MGLSSRCGRGGGREQRELRARTICFCGGEHQSQEEHGGRSPFTGDTLHMGLIFLQDGILQTFGSPS
ncbi:hypothetical protein ROHU_026001 [Labeo rohita]|uniref:Uncharacterized protein n=1 Tax=Labeo rohita TaxID=84645 RepID=A0A498LPE6_LABRO|nr:hypothetical protein ROHU_011019 [Labeo rohita]RXN18708.1 hypothetical protein ROHU_026001 [Labeo rohita]